jgi:hypothetical protein
VRDRGRLLLALAVAVAGPSLQAGPPIETSIGSRALAEAVRLGASADDPALERFHAAYRLPLGGPFLQSIEIVSEFRRAVLIAEGARRTGEPLSERGAGRALEPYRGLVTIVVNVRFDPQNTHRSMPLLEAVLYPPAGGVAEPVDQQSRPSYLSGPAPAGTPVLEGRLEASFLASSLDERGQHLVGVFVDGREIRRIPVDLSAVR